MTQDEFIDMARQSDFEIHSDNLISFDGIDCTSELIAFAKLVAEKAIKEALAQPEQKYHRGDRLICLETEEYCVIHISGTDRQWVKFPDSHIGVYTNEQVAELFELLSKEPEQEPVAWEQFYPDIGKPKFEAHPEQEPTYTSTQATNCAVCGEHKHTPLRIDSMGGYVCLTCIDKKLGSLLGEFGYEQPDQEPVDFDAIIADIEAISCRYRGDPSHDHCPYKIRSESADTVRRHASYYTTPPQPTQVKLKDDEIWKFWWARPEISEGEDDSMEAEFVAVVRAVLAAHNIKE